MVTQFITLKVGLKDPGLTLQDRIDASLRREGKPLRWAITGVKGTMVHVEAVVLIDSGASSGSRA